MRAAHPHALGALPRSDGRRGFQRRGALGGTPNAPRARQEEHTRRQQKQKGLGSPRAWRSRAYWLDRRRGTPLRRSGLVACPVDLKATQSLREIQETRCLTNVSVRRSRTTKRDVQAGGAGQKKRQRNKKRRGVAHGLGGERRASRPHRRHSVQGRIKSEPRTVSAVTTGLPALMSPGRSAQHGSVGVRVALATNRPARRFLHRDPACQHFVRSQNQRSLSVRTISALGTWKYSWCTPPIGHARAGCHLNAVARDDRRDGQRATTSTKHREIG